MRAPRPLFGRNLDLDVGFDERAVVTPRRFPLPFRKQRVSNEHFAFIGTARIADGYPLYADAINEKGVFACGLNFPVDNLYGAPDKSEKYGVTPFELIPWVLSRCATLREAKKLLSATRLIALPFREDLPLTPLHWHIADESGSLAAESENGELKLYDNPTDTLSNAPAFPDQLRLYERCAHLSPSPIRNEDKTVLGAGAIGLLGDYTSPARFSKGAWLLAHAPNVENESAIAYFFSLLASVAPPEGAVLSEAGKPHFTRYSCCADGRSGVYYYRTHERLQISRIALRDVDLDGFTLSVQKL